MRRCFCWISFPCSGNYVGKSAVFHFCFSTFAQEKKQLLVLGYQIKKTFKEVSVFCVVHKHVSKEDAFFFGTNLHTQTCNLEQNPTNKTFPETSTFQGAHGSNSLQTAKTKPFTSKSNRLSSQDSDESPCSVEKIFNKKNCGSQGISWLS